MNASMVAAFWAVSFLFIITPGVDWAYAISAGMRGRVVLPAVGGMLAGHFVATLVVAAGVGGLVASNPAAVTALTTLGAAYLLWLGINMALRPAALQGAGSAAAVGADNWLQWAGKGLCVSGLNPKVLLMFLALLPQFIDPHAGWAVPAQILALGLVHMMTCSVVYLLVGFGAQVVLRSRPAAARVVSRVSGVAMVLIAIGLFAESWRAV